jgi:hypothetical protein
LVTAKSNGNAVITVTTEDGSYTATCTVTVSKSSDDDDNNDDDDDPATAVETRHAASLQPYPNPTSGVVYIDNPDGEEVEVYNVTGALVMSVETRHAASLQSSGSATIDISHLPAGVYIIRIGGKTAKVVKR